MIMTESWQKRRAKALARKWEDDKVEGGNCGMVLNGVGNNGHGGVEGENEIGGLGH